MPFSSGWYRIVSDWVLFDLLPSCLTIARKLRKLGGNGPHNVEKQFNHIFPRENGFVIFSPWTDKFHVFLIF